MKVLFFAALSVLVAALSPLAVANTAQYMGEAEYEWHLAPPSLMISGEAAAAIKKDLGFSSSKKKIEITIECDDAVNSAPATCTMELPEH